MDVIYDLLNFHRLAHDMKLQEVSIALRISTSNSVMGLLFHSMEVIDSILLLVTPMENISELSGARGAGIEDRGCCGIPISYQYACAHILNVTPMVSFFGGTENERSSAGMFVNVGKLIFLSPFQQSRASIRRSRECSRVRDQCTRLYTIPYLSRDVQS